MNFVPCVKDWLESFIKNNNNKNDINENYFQRYIVNRILSDHKNSNYWELCINKKINNIKQISAGKNDDVTWQSSSKTSCHISPDLQLYDGNRYVLVELKVIKYDELGDDKCYPFIYSKYNNIEDPALVYEYIRQSKYPKIIRILKQKLYSK